MPHPGCHATLAAVLPPRNRRPCVAGRDEPNPSSRSSGSRSASRRRVLAVDDLSFTVEHGQVCGLLGPNGAGKTTCLRMLLGLIRPTAGETRLFGERVAPGQRAAAAGRRADRVVGVRARTCRGCENLRAVVGGRGRALGRRRRRTGARHRRSRRRDRPQGEDLLAGHAPAPRVGARAARSTRDPGARRAHQRARSRRRCARCVSSCTGSPKPARRCCSRATSSPRSSRSAPTRS